jgi:hypothetical protein
MAQVEAVVGLRGRRYYGAFHSNGEYLVCVALRERDDPAAYGLERGQLPAAATRGCGSKASRPPSTSRSHPASTP